MIRRQLQRLVATRLTQSPAVAIVGPRQAGKTTLAKALGGSYFDLEVDADRTRVDVTWDELRAQKELVILDEAQSHPSIFPRIRAAIDEQRDRNGRFLLLGSVGPELMRDVSESLAGRLSLVELTPFLLEELGSGRLKDLWMYGGLPEAGVLQADRYPTWSRDYLTLLAQRDLPAWGLPATPAVTSRLFQMLAAVHGQEWNASALGSSLAITYHTVNSYLDYLEGAFLIRRLRPFHANLKKRLVKRPKVYWRDSGLLHALQQVGNLDELYGRPWVGSSWEGFVIEQAIGTLQTLAIPCEPYFFKTSDRHELDLVLDFGRELWAVEIKLTTNPRPEQLESASRVAEMLNADRVILVSQVQRSAVGSDRSSCNLPRFLKLLADM